MWFIYEKAGDASASTYFNPTPFIPRGCIFIATCTHSLHPIKQSGVICKSFCCSHYWVKPLHWYTFYICVNLISVQLPFLQSDYQNSVSPWSCFALGHKMLLASLSGTHGYAWCNYMPICVWLLVQFKVCPSQFKLIKFWLNIYALLDCSIFDHYQWTIDWKLGLLTATTWHFPIQKRNFSFEIMFTYTYLWIDQIEYSRRPNDSGLIICYLHTFYQYWDWVMQTGMSSHGVLLVIKWRQIHTANKPSVWAISVGTCLHASYNSSQIIHNGVAKMCIFGKNNLYNVH